MKKIILIVLLLFTINVKNRKREDLYIVKVDVTIPSFSFKLKKIINCCLHHIGNKSILNFAFTSPVTLVII